MVDSGRLPPSRKNSGRCQIVISTARIAVETSGERVATSGQRCNDDGGEEWARTLRRTRMVRSSR
jgi:hypothetical protein